MKAMWHQRNVNVVIVSVAAYVAWQWRGSGKYHGETYPRAGHGGINMAWQWRSS